MANIFNKGDTVEWTTPQGQTVGTIENKLTKPTDIETHKVVASPSIQLPDRKPTERKIGSAQAGGAAEMPSPRCSIRSAEPAVRSDHKRIIRTFGNFADNGRR
jgi:hypothetical protein